MESSIIANIFNLRCIFVGVEIPMVTEIEVHSHWKTNYVSYAIVERIFSNLKIYWKSLKLM